MDKLASPARQPLCPTKKETPVASSYLKLDEGAGKIARQEVFREQYIKWLRHSTSRQRPLLEERLAQAWQIARKAAKILRERYGASRVRVFGSLLQPDRFHDRSDVDLAVEGLAVQDYWDAMADVFLLNDEIMVDLVDPDTCSPALWARVEHEGEEV